jgi:hypothetical protein
VEIVTYQDNAIQNYNDLENVAKAMVSSGYFTDSTKISQAIVKIMAGREIGIGPFSSMNGIHIIQGKPAFGAGIMAGKVKSSGRYNYRVTENTDTVCTVEFMEHFNGSWTTIGTSSFSIADAKKAGTKNLDKFPRNMLFARAMSNGVRWYCPDVMNGSVVYTPEELGADVDENGDVIDVEVIDQVRILEKVEAPDPMTDLLVKTFAVDAPSKVEPDIMTIERAMKVQNSEGVSYGDIPNDKLQAMILGINKGLKNGVDDEKRAEYLEKKQAIGVILKARANKEI